MIREDVLFVYNREEKDKITIIKDIISQLEAEQLCCSLIEPNDDLLEILKLRNSKCIVFDYFLGTAGSVIEIIEKQKYKENIIVFSDEKSVDVIVSVIKQGINNYIELKKTSIQKLKNNIFSLIRKKPSSNKTTKKQKYIFHSTSSKQLLKQIDATSTNNTLLVGARGSGRSTVAKLIHEKKSFFGAFQEIEVDLTTKNIKSYFEEIKTKRIAFPTQSTIFLDRIEYGNENLLKTLRDFKVKNIQIIIGTSCINMAKAVNRLLYFNTIEIPPLLERKEEIDLLINSFKNNSPENIKKLTKITKSKDWPGNLRQLKAVIIGIENALDHENEKELDEKFSFLKQTWEKYNSIEKAKPEKILTLKTYINSNKDISITAAKLGTSSHIISEVLNDLRVN